MPSVLGRTRAAALIESAALAMLFAQVQRSKPRPGSAASRSMKSGVRHLVSIDDLSLAEIQALFEHAKRFSEDLRAWCATSVPA